MRTLDLNWNKYQNVTLLADFADLLESYDAAQPGGLQTNSTVSNFEKHDAMLNNGSKYYMSNPSNCVCVTIPGTY